MQVATSVRQMELAHFNNLKLKYAMDGLLGTYHLPLRDVSFEVKVSPDLLLKVADGEDISVDIAKALKTMLEEKNVAVEDILSYEVYYIGDRDLQPPDVGVVFEATLKSKDEASSASESVSVE